ncbi:FAD-binding oxidoreductase [Streptomyces sp. NWU49]|uniref:FAD-binding oxidoreductase n=1 Tax=Streptomyces sp. NWU49 TaxID=2201153 RepID=UPI0015E818AC|nr:FAD-binding oxidoreductase [Streptomyces sp. NWU49]
MSRDRLSAWLAACEKLLGADSIHAPVGLEPGDGATNVSLFRSRCAPATVRPMTTAQVRHMLRTLSEEVPGVSVYPLSTGRNWGLGSAEPVDDGAVVLDLSRMDRIRSLDVGLGLAVVEPGVTQGRLAHALHGTPMMLNVTASSAHTSVVGNAMDRGVGLRRQRCDDIIGLEVVLADGTEIQVGAWPDDDTPRAPYPHGLGPGLVPLFLQSNLGVVTAAVVKLLPRPEQTRMVTVRFAAEDLEPAVDELRHLYTRGLAHGVLKIYSASAVGVYGGLRRSEYVAYICVDGVASVVAAALAEVERALGESGLFHDFRCLSPTDQGADVVEDVVLHALTGDPSRNDDMLRATFGVTAHEVDATSDQGWLFFLPMIPFTGRAVAQARSLLEKVKEATGVDCGMTVNAITFDLIDLVVSIRFTRNFGEVEAAHRALNLLYEWFPAQGFVPYRVDIDHMGLVPALRSHPGQSRLVELLKTALDPQSLISPGRYPAFPHH